MDEETRTALLELKARIDALDYIVQELREMRSSIGLNPVNPTNGSSPVLDVRAFAQQLIQQIGAELDALRPQDDGKTLGAMQDGVLHDGKGVALARYSLPSGHILVWQREDDPPGFSLKTLEADGVSTPYERKNRG